MRMNADASPDEIMSVSDRLYVFKGLQSIGNGQHRLNAGGACGGDHLVLVLGETLRMQINVTIDEHVGRRLP